MEPTSISTPLPALGAGCPRSGRMPPRRDQRPVRQPRLPARHWPGFAGWLLRVWLPRALSVWIRGVIRSTVEFVVGLLVIAGVLLWLLVHGMAYMGGGLMLYALFGERRLLHDPSALAVMGVTVLCLLYYIAFPNAVGNCMDGR